MSELVGLGTVAAKLGMSVEQLFQCMLDDGLVLRHPGGGYVVAPSPDIVRIGGENVV